MPNRPPLGMPGLAPQLQTGVANLAGNNYTNWIGANDCLPLC